MPLIFIPIKNQIRTSARPTRTQPVSKVSEIESHPKFKVTSRIKGIVT